MNGVLRRSLGLLGMLTLALGCAEATGPQSDQQRAAAGLAPYVHTDPYLKLWYPESWLQLRLNSANQVLRVAGPNGLPLLSVNILPKPPQLMLSYANQTLIPNLENAGTNVQVVSTRRLRLQGGGRASESVASWQLNSGVDVVTVYVSAFSQDHWVIVSLTHAGTEVRDDLRQIVRTLSLKAPAAAG